MAVSWSVTSSNFPYLPLLVQVHQRDTQVEALLDTGFEGDVALPNGLVGNGQPPDGYTPWILADGSTVFAPTYDGTVRVGEGPLISVAITVLGSQPLVGRGVTDRFKIILDHGQEIILEP